MTPNHSNQKRCFNGKENISHQHMRPTTSKPSIVVKKALKHCHINHPSKAFPSPQKIHPFLEHRPLVLLSLSPSIHTPSTDVKKTSCASPYLKKRKCSLSPLASIRSSPVRGMRCATRVQSFKERIGSKNWLMRCPEDFLQELDLFC